MLTLVHGCVNTVLDVIKPGMTEEPRKRLSAKDAQKELERLRNKLLSITSSVQAGLASESAIKEQEPVAEPEVKPAAQPPSPVVVEEPDWSFPFPERKSIQDNRSALTSALVLIHVCQRASNSSDDEGLFTEDDLNLNDPDLISELKPKHPGYRFKPKKSLLKDGVEQRLWQAFVSTAESYAKIWSEIVSAAGSKTKLDQQVRAALDEHLPTLVCLSEELDEQRRLLSWATIIRLHEAGVPVGVDKFILDKHTYGLNKYHHAQ